MQRLPSLFLTMFIAVGLPVSAPTRAVPLSETVAPRERPAVEATKQEPGAEVPKKDEAPQKEKRKKRVKAVLVPAPTEQPGEEAETPAESSPDEAEPAEAAEPAPAAEAEAGAAAAAEPESRAPVEEKPRAPAETTTPARTADRPAHPQPTLSERIEVVEVLLDVLVTDAQGNVVTGLRPEDFRVEEEGRPVEVTSLTAYGTEAQLRAAGTDGEQRSDRYFILFFHDQARNDSNLRRSQMEAGRRAARWVAEELLPNDQVAVLAWDVRLKVYTDFTRDRAEVLAALDRAATGRREPERERGRETAPPPFAEASSPSLLLNLPAGKDLRDQTKIFQKTLALVGRAAEGIVGRKNLILFSVGFGNLGAGGVWTPDVRYYPDLEESLNAGNVAVYAIDMRAPGRGGAAPPGLVSSLSSLAADTGGTFYDTFTSFATPMRRVAEDNRGYYLLSYRAEYPRGTRGYRDIRVEVAGDYRVRYRRGYRYGSDESPR